jgi:lipoprotein signal peptidase
LFAEDAATAVWLLVTAKMAVVAVLAAWLFRTTVLQEVLGLSLIIGGAIGNTVDRLRLGAVVDFIDAHYRGWHWPTFNVADMAIVCGVATILISTLRAKPSRVTVQ